MTAVQRVEQSFSLNDLGSMLPLTLLRVREVMMERIRPILQQYGLTEVQWRVLRVLYKHGTIDFSDLARETVVQRASLSRIVPTLAEKGLATRETNPDDHRLVTIAFTEKGEELVDRIMPRIIDVYRDIEAKTEDPGFQQFRAVLDSFITKAGTQPGHQ